jgi:hypothetical protein
MVRVQVHGEVVEEAHVVDVIGNPNDTGAATEKIAKKGGCQLQ